MNLRLRIIGYFAGGLALTLLATTAFFSIRSANEIRTSLISERLALAHSVDYAIETGLQRGLDGEFEDYVRDRLDQITSEGNVFTPASFTTPN